MNKVSTKIFKSPVGELLIGIYENQLCLCDWRYRRMRAAIDHRICSALRAELVEDSHILQDRCIQQLNEYFSGERIQFDLPLLEVGTEFQKCVWDQLRKIPYSENRSYLWLAEQLQKPQAVRAVASANGANAISIVTPCHRVIGSDGKLVGYAGGLPAKAKLLEIEKSTIDSRDCYRSTVFRSTLFPMEQMTS